MKKIAIIGCGGSGKSTLAIQLHERLGLPLIHLDQVFWKPNWVEMDRTEWQRVNQEIIRQPAWVIDGNYGSTMTERLKEADTIIYLDFSRWRSLYRVLKRTALNLGKSRITMGKDCPERFDWQFIKYVFHYNDTRRPKILKMLEGYKGIKQIYILENPKKVETFLKNVKSFSNSNSYVGTTF